MVEQLTLALEQPVRPAPETMLCWPWTRRFRRDGQFWGFRVTLRGRG